MGVGWGGGGVGGGGGRGRGRVAGPKVRGVHSHMRWCLWCQLTFMRGPRLHSELLSHSRRQDCPRTVQTKTLQAPNPYTHLRPAQLPARLHVTCGRRRGQGRRRQVASAALDCNIRAGRVPRHAAAKHTSRCHCARFRARYGAGWAQCAREGSAGQGWEAVTRRSRATLAPLRNCCALVNELEASAYIVVLEVCSDFL